GYNAKWIKVIKLPKAMAPIMPSMIIPIISSVCVRLVFIFLIGAPISTILVALTTCLIRMHDANLIILAMFIGRMISFYMAGPV
ncbi:hypothetical protein FE72_15490, partial [Staphylococcus aureus]